MKYCHVEDDSCIHSLTLSFPECLLPGHTTYSLSTTGHVEHRTLHPLRKWDCISIIDRSGLGHLLREKDVGQAVRCPPVKVSIILSILHSECICNLGYLPFQPVAQNWSIKGSGMCSPVSGKVHLKRPLVAYWKESPIWQQRVSSKEVSQNNHMFDVQ